MINIPVTRRTFVRSLIAETINSSLNRSLRQSPIAAVGLHTPEMRPANDEPRRPRRRARLLRVRPVRSRRLRSLSEPTTEPLEEPTEELTEQELDEQEQRAASLIDLTADITRAPNRVPAEIPALRRRNAWTSSPNFGDRVANGPDALWQTYENIYYSPQENYRKLKRIEDNEIQETRSKKQEQQQRKRRRKSKEPVYQTDEPKCTINGTENCNDSIVTFDCGCNSICRSCATSWLQNSSTCPFCRKPVTKYTEKEKRPRTVANVQQRGDHDLSVNYYQFTFYNDRNIKVKHDIIMQESYIFANQRTKKVSKEMLIYLQMVSSSLQNRFVMPADAVVHFMNNIFLKKINNFAVHSHLIFRTAVYYSLYGQSDYLLGKAITFLEMMTKHVKHRRLVAKKSQQKNLEIDIFNEKKIKISQEVFRAPPLKILFTKSIANMILHADNTNLYKTMVIDLLTDVEPSLIYVLAVAREHS